VDVRGRGVRLELNLQDRDDDLAATRGLMAQLNRRRDTPPHPE
jgi:hypothetical protein